MDTQTLLHPVSSRIVKHYTWNEWELRRRGLTLVTTKNHTNYIIPPATINLNTMDLKYSPKSINA